MDASAARDSLLNLIDLIRNDLVSSRQVHDLMRRHGHGLDGSSVKQVTVLAVAMATDSMEAQQ